MCDLYHYYRYAGDELGRHKYSSLEQILVTTVFEHCPDECSTNRFECQKLEFETWKLKIG